MTILLSHCKIPSVTYVFSLFIIALLFANCPSISLIYEVRLQWLQRESPCHAVIPGAASAAGAVSSSVVTRPRTCEHLQHWLQTCRAVKVNNRDGARNWWRELSRDGKTVMTPVSRATESHARGVRAARRIMFWWLWYKWCHMWHSLV